MNKLLNLLAVLLLAASTSAYSTPQLSDILILGGEEVGLFSNPLKPLIDSERIKLPEPDEVWTNNWRGYVATWQITDDQLSLTKVTVLLRPKDSEEGEPAVPTDVFPQLFDNQTTVFADWFTGVLLVPRGDLVSYVHMGYSSLYEKYTILQIDKGRVVSRQELDATQYMEFRNERFAAYLESEEYAFRRNEMIKAAEEFELDELSDEEIEGLLYHNAVEEYLSIPPEKKTSSQPVWTE